MAQPETPQIYLITPPNFELAGFGQTLARALDTVEVACLRLRLATTDVDDIARAADSLREIAHPRDLAVVIDSHVGLVEKLGLDGVHLTGEMRGIAKLRKTLGSDAILGVDCGSSRHDGMNAAEQGADYISFGPVSPSELGTGDVAPRDLFAWWSEMIEVPVVAEGGLTNAMVEGLSDVTDFFGIGPEIWDELDPAAALERLTRHLA